MKNIAKTAALAWRYLWSRPLAAALNLLLLTLGLAAITLVLLVSTQLDRAFERDLEGIDLVVGAKGSPLQLILAGVFHIDVPTGNIPLQEVQALQQNPLVAQVVPLSLGDSYQGYRIVGTTPDYVAAMGWAGGGTPMATTPTASAACWRPAAVCWIGSSLPALNRSGRCTKPPRPKTPKTWKS